MNRFAVAKKPSSTVSILKSPDFQVIVWHQTLNLQLKCVTFWIKSFLQSIKSVAAVKKN